MNSNGFVYGRAFNLLSPVLSFLLIELDPFLSIISNGYRRLVICKMMEHVVYFIYYDYSLDVTCGSCSNFNTFHFVQQQRQGNRDEKGLLLRAPSWTFWRRCSPKLATRTSSCAKRWRWKSTCRSLESRWAPPPLTGARVWPGAADGHPRASGGLKRRTMICAYLTTVNWLLNIFLNSN